MLTKKQKNLLSYIKKFIDKNDYSPSIEEIAKYFKVTQPTISHHLLYLKEAGILKSRREGRNSNYYIDPKCGWDMCEVFG